jgi:hypothetical protein
MLGCMRHQYVHGRRQLATDGGVLSKSRIVGWGREAGWDLTGKVKTSCSGPGSWPDSGLENVK